MKPIFDMQLISKNRLRAFRQKDSSAYFLLEIVAKEISFRLNMIQKNFASAMELHGVTGVVGRTCLETQKVSQLIRAEISKEFASANDKIIISSFEEIPSTSQPIDLILSPLHLHIVNDVLGVLLKINNALEPGGIFLAALPGIGTINELRKALLTAETELTGGASPRIIPFIDIKSAGDLVQRAGFTSPIIDQDTHTVYYKSIFHLMYDLRKMGMSNPLIKRSKRYNCKSLFIRASEIYEKENSDGKGNVKATFSIIYVIGWKCTNKTK